MEFYRAIKYIRLSYTDDRNTESDSVGNQRRMIDDFIAKHPEIDAVAEKIDDGYSGVLFDRPAFQEMMQMIQRGEANCVIVKDLSRLGREYIETGRYIIVPNTHPALVSHEVFDAVQAYRQEVTEASKAKKISSYTPNIYKGKVFCAHCGCSLHRQRSTRKKGPDVYVLHCLTNSRVNKKGCDGVMITETELSQTVTEILSRELTAELGNRASLSRVKSEQEKEQARIAKALADKHRTLDNSRKMQRTLYEDHIKGILPDVDYENLRREAQALRDRLEAEIQALESEQAAIEKQMKKQQRMEEGAAELEKTKLLTAGLLDKLISRIEVSHSHEVSISFLFRDAFGKAAAE